ncbi:MAG: 5'-nucleotidase C-terminal domain-containing protein [Bacteroidales bacterium]|nr:5'-nucleotidase C-terminal domain-containing protein [Bacteroidales bacterium]
MKKGILYLVLVILFASCGSINNKPESYNLVIVETSDVHGAVFDFDFINNKSSQGSLSKVQTYLNNLRDTTNCILMDNGDILQGQPIVYYDNYENTNDIHICSKVMNYMKYDVATIGNHDIEAGHAVYDKINNEINFPWLAANAIDTESGEPYFKPYTIINKDGIKIAVFGLITPGIPKWLPEELWAGIEFEDMVVSAKKWVPEILKKENPDLLIGLFHAGFDYTYGNVDYDTPKNENASVIVAEQVPGFDVIFIGHDHYSWNEKITNVNGDEVIVLGPASSARQVVTANISFKLNAKNQYDKLIVGDIVNIKDYKADSLFDAKFKPEFKTIEEFVSRKVGDFKKSVFAQKAIYGPSEFMNLIHQIQLDMSNADISFAAPLSFNSTINEGPVYVRDMFKLYRFENFLYKLNLSGKEIDGYLEYSYANWFNTMSSENDHLLLFKKDSNGELEYSERYQSYALKTNYYNFDGASGINYTVDLRKPAGDKVEINSMSDGSVFSIDSMYSVAVNSYRGNGGGGHLVHGAGIPESELNQRRISSTEKDLRYYMMKWIEEQQVIDPQETYEWNVVPENWWLKAQAKDYKLLNKN